MVDPKQKRGLGNGPGFDRAFFGNPTLHLNVVPEPSTLILIAVGAVGLAGCSWRKRKRA